MPPRRLDALPACSQVNPGVVVPHQASTMSTPPNHPARRAHYLCGTTGTLRRAGTPVLMSELWNAKECHEVGHRRRVLDQEQVPTLVLAQLGSANSRRDRRAVLSGSDSVIASVGNDGRAGDRVEPVPYIMACAGLQLSLACGCDRCRWFSPVAPRPSRRSVPVPTPRVPIGVVVRA